MPARQGEGPGCTLMTSPPSTFISFWRFLERRLGLERHFSSPSRLTGWEEGESQHSFTCCQTRTLPTPQAPCPTLAAQGIQREKPHPGGTQCCSLLAPQRAQGEHPLCLSSRHSVMWPHRQALPSSLHPHGRETKTQNSRSQPWSCGFPMNLSEKGPQAGGPWVAVLPPLMPSAGRTMLELGPGKSPCAPCDSPTPIPGACPVLPAALPTRGSRSAAPLLCRAELTAAGQMCMGPCANLPALLPGSGRDTCRAQPRHRTSWWSAQHCQEQSGPCRPPTACTTAAQHRKLPDFSTIKA